MKKIITIIKIVKFFSETNYKKLLELVIDKLYEKDALDCLLNSFTVQNLSDTDFKIINDLQTSCFNKVYKDVLKCDFHHYTKLLKSFTSIKNSFISRLIFEETEETNIAISFILTQETSIENEAINDLKKTIIEKILFVTSSEKTIAERNQRFEILYEISQNKNEFKNVYIEESLNIIKNYINKCTQNEINKNIYVNLFKRYFENNNFINKEDIQLYLLTKVEFDDSFYFNKIKIKLENNIFIKFILDLMEYSKLPILKRYKLITKQNKINEDLINQFIEDELKDENFKDIIVKTHELILKNDSKINISNYYTEQIEVLKETIIDIINNDNINTQNIMLDKLNAKLNINLKLEDLIIDFKEKKFFKFKENLEDKEIINIVEKIQNNRIENFYNKLNLI